MSQIECLLRSNKKLLIFALKTRRNQGDEKKNKKHAPTKKKTKKRNKTKRRTKQGNKREKGGVFFFTRVTRERP